MKKLILKESQIERIMDKIISEQIEDDGYKREIKISLSPSYDSRYKGSEINEITPYSDKITVSFIIEMEYKQWGINGVNLSSINGPSEIEAEISFYPNDSDDYVTETITIPLDWENSLIINKENNTGIITVGDELVVNVSFNENNDITTEMELDIYSL